jgi:hypothetical protein
MVLDIALPQHNQAVARLTLATLDRELRDLAEAFPERRNPAVEGGVEERVGARAALKGLVLALHEVDTEVAAGRFDSAVADLARYRNTLTDALPQMRAAQAWSLFNSQVHAAHFAAQRKLFRVGADPALAPARRPDAD